MGRCQILLEADGAAKPSLAQDGKEEILVQSSQNVLTHFYELL
jgi:hypothetical protein